MARFFDQISQDLRRGVCIWRVACLIGQPFHQPKMPPPMPPRPMGAAFRGHARPAVVIETFLDLCCPFSKKMFVTLFEKVMPMYADNASIEWIFQNVPQPWHPQSSYMHEALLAVKSIDEAKFFDAALVIFNSQEQFYGLT